MKLFSNYPAEVLILLFLIITFVLSGFEKISDWRGNIDFIKNHFQKSPLKNNVPLLLTILLIIEIIASILMTIGVYQIYVSESKEIALIGIELSAVSLILMLVGQRLAKDYSGAMSLAVYFIITLFGVYLLNS